MNTQTTRPGPGLKKLLNLEEGKLALRYLSEDPDRVDEFVAALLDDPEVKKAFPTADILSAYVVALVGGRVGRRGLNA